MSEDDPMLKVLREILNWTRASSFSSVKTLLQEALPDRKSRTAFQMFDGTKTIDQIRIASKMSPNAVIGLSQRCVAMGLMETRADKKRVRLFDLSDFGLLSSEDLPDEREKA